MQINFAVSMHNTVSHFSYPCFMDTVNEHFTYLWIINSIIHVQWDESNSARSKTKIGKTRLWETWQAALNTFHLLTLPLIFPSYERFFLLIVVNTLTPVVISLQMLWCDGKNTGSNKCYCSCDADVSFFESYRCGCRWWWRKGTILCRTKSVVILRSLSMKFCLITNHFSDVPLNFRASSAKKTVWNYFGVNEKLFVMSVKELIPNH